ncbi:hypothetical protein SAMN05444159_3359 [Bradyrhizobium lablabi]|uniref:MetA-pathway of phenol degradation n=1 Tax=Bradyrhizobium lablabi TaxID=722472 RepID=A0A1M6STG4_9BRAD|nr:hypothetical protein [Bradyrhizobium lablabi]SHK47979.1 hypothetical protein SAMN05444159_3359 [Bradyrhizobium lablabi]
MAPPSSGFAACTIGERFRASHWLACSSALIAALVASQLSQTADAHGIAGNRYFPGTLTFDDPAVADEAIVPNFSTLEHPDAGADVTDNRINWSFTRLLTPTVGFVVDSSWIARNWGAAKRSGFDVTSVGLKWEVFRDNPHEMLLSAGLAWGIGKSGAQAVDASAPDTIRPGLFFGKGFGDLPDSVSWLRPFGVTAAIVLEHPTGGVSRNFGIDPLTGQLGPMLTSNVDILHWGFAVEFSTLYLTSRFTGGPPKQEPLNQLVPLVEFAFDSSKGTKSIATMNPGLTYVAVTWQIAIEAIVPLNNASGHNIGGRAQLLLFLDDLAPSLFGKPLLSQ